MPLLVTLGSECPLYQVSYQWLGSVPVEQTVQDIDLAKTVVYVCIILQYSYNIIGIILMQECDSLFIVGFTGM